MFFKMTSNITTNAVSSNRFRLFIILAWASWFLGSTQAVAQVSLGWDKLADVQFDLLWFEEHQTKFMVPRFGKTPNAFKGKKVRIKGYVIPIDPVKNQYVLSKVPMAMCFFCGSSGSETIVELEMKKGFQGRYDTDDVVTFQGVLNLNSKDVMHFIYILKEAQEVKGP